MSQLKLSPGARIHDVFHVGLLNKYTGDPPTAAATLSPIRHGKICLEPEEALKCRLARGRQELLVRWKNQVAVEASWVDLEEFCQLYTDFQLEDELLLQEERDVMVGIKYSRRNRKESGQQKAHSTY
jgi:hypothetical protein